MAGVKISNLPAATVPLTGTELIAVVQGGATKQAAIGGTIPAAQIINTPTGTIAATNVQTAINEIVTDLSASSGSSLVGFLQAGTGAVARTVQAKERDVVSVKDFGAVGDGVTDDTAAIQAALDSGAAGVFIPQGTYLCGALTIPSNVQLYGEGAASILKVKNSANATLLTNDDTVGGNSGIELRDFAIDGNYTNQTGSPNGIQLSVVTMSKVVGVSISNVRGMGVLLTDSDGNELSGIVATACGKAVAGYGIYLYNSSFNRVVDCRTDDNCIGIAIESNGVGKKAEFNVASNCTGQANRADFSQSGATVHIEQSGSGDAGGNIIVGCVAKGSTGAGFNNTAGSNVTFSACTAIDNALSGFTASAAQNITLSGCKAFDNAASESVGYQAQIRFDDTGLNPASTGVVSGCEGSGTVDGIKTLSVNSSIRVLGCMFSGSTTSYNLNGTDDALEGVDKDTGNVLRKQVSFRAGLSSGVVNAAADIIFDVVNHNVRSAYNVANGVFTAPVAGIYLFAVNVVPSDANRIYWELQLSGNAIIAGGSAAGAATENYTGNSVVVSLAQNAALKVRLVLGQAYNIPTGTNFSGYLLG